MKKTLIVLTAISIALLLAVVSAAVIPLFMDDKTGVEAPGKIIYDPDGDDGEGIELTYLKSLEYADKAVSAYTRDDDGMFYLFDEDMNFFCLISDPDISITNSERFENALDNPEKQLTKDDAIALAYDCAAETYGDFIRDFGVKNVIEDEYRRIVLLARVFKAKDFEVFGSVCSVITWIDGEISLCSFKDGNEGSGVQDLVAELSMAEIGTFVNEQTDNNYGNKVKESEITSVDYLVRDDRDVLSVEVRTVVTELLYLAPEIPENGENRESEEVKTDYYYFPLEG